jgi:hypothetical protein
VIDSIPQDINDQIAIATATENLVQVLGPENEWWLVAPFYVAPVGIGQAETLAESLGFELPTPKLVDAIYEASDLKVDASKMIFTPKEGSDYSFKTMASQATFDITYMKLTKQILGKSFTLLGGSHKDVVKKDGVIGIYGWQPARGSTIQGFYTKHDHGWIDYSQGLRLVRRA